MFKRSFMEAYKVRKNANPTAIYGTISTNWAYVTKRDRILTRGGIYFMTALAMVFATNSFEIFYEVFRHLPEPAQRTYYEHSVPK